MALFEHFYGQLKSFVPLALALKPLQNGLKCGAAQQVHLTGTLLMVVPAKLEIYESNSLSQKFMLPINGFGLLGVQRSQGRHRL